jgi:hypothetical protein
LFMLVISGTDNGVSIVLKQRTQLSGTGEPLPGSGRPRRRAVVPAYLTI